jgi:aquaporin NIP
MTLTLLRSCFAEILGTFALVFAGTGAIVINDVSHGAITHPGIALVFGLVVMALIYTLGPVSGAHLNPAVTLGLCAARAFRARHAPAYIASQLTGALAASLVLHALFPAHATLGATLPAGSDLQSFILEVLLTGGLLLAILCTAVRPAANTAFVGLAVGGVIGLEAMFAGPICGASMNPARSLGPALISGETRALWVYLVAPVLGGLLAVPCWSFITGVDVPTTPA